MAFCEHCGEQRSLDAAFCGSCGKPASSSARPSGTVDRRLFGLVIVVAVILTGVVALRSGGEGTPSAISTPNSAAARSSDPKTFAVSALQNIVNGDLDAFRSDLRPDRRNDFETSLPYRDDLSGCDTRRADVLTEPSPFGQNVTEVTIVFAQPCGADYSSGKLLKTCRLHVANLGDRLFLDPGLGSFVQCS